MPGLDYNHPMPARSHVVLALLISLSCFACDGGEDLGAAPEAVLEVATEVDVGASLLLDGSRSTDPDGNIQSYRFIVADGSGALPTTSATTRHSFTISGLIEVRLQVTDTKGNIGEDSAVVSVREP
jgi:chitinase